MIDRLFLAALTFCLLAAGTLAIGSAWFDHAHSAQSQSQALAQPRVVYLPIVEVTGKLRHDRWKDKATGRWTGKVFIAVDPGEGAVRSKGIAQTAEPDQAAA